jgi:hypothetical protein
MLVFWSLVTIKMQQRRQVTFRHAHRRIYCPIQLPGAIWEAHIRLVCFVLHAAQANTADAFEFVLRIGRCGCRHKLGGRERAGRAEANVFVFLKCLNDAARLAVEYSDDVR